MNFVVLLVPELLLSLNFSEKSAAMSEAPHMTDKLGAPEAIHYQGLRSAMNVYAEVWARLTYFQPCQSALPLL